jgi:hypothetical protein
MYKAVLTFIALVLLIACSSTPAPTPTASQAPANPAPTPTAAPLPTTSGGDVQATLQEIAGKNATNCGNVKALSGDVVTKASDCAMESAKSKKPFLVSYDMPGLSVGVAGNADGKFFMAQSSGEGGKAETKSQPCPSEVRIAQSGRVTCMPAGSMGVAAGSGNPHAGGMPATPGTANPHATAPNKSH